MRNRCSPQVRNPVNYVVQVVSLTNVRVELSKKTLGFGEARRYAERMAPRLAGWRLPSMWSAGLDGDEVVSVDVVCKCPWRADEIALSVPVDPIPVKEVAVLPLAVAA
jgi:hypothetical protein